MLLFLWLLLLICLLNNRRRSDSFLGVRVRRRRRRSTTTTAAHGTTDHHGAPAHAASRRLHFWSHFSDHCNDKNEAQKIPNGMNDRKKIDSPSQKKIRDYFITSLGVRLYFPFFLDFRRLWLFLHEIMISIMWLFIFLQKYCFIPPKKESYEKKNPKPREKWSKNMHQDAENHLFFSQTAH